MSIVETFVRFHREQIEQSIPSRFERQAERHPGRLAVKTSRCEFTYAMLNSFANQVAHGILSRRGEGEETVALLCNQDTPLIAAILGVLKAGRIYVPLNPEHPPARIAGILADSRAPLILADPENLRLASEIAGSDVMCVEQAVQTFPAGIPALIQSPERPAYIYYTSGTTGRPKGVVDSHRNVLHNIMRYTNGLRIGPQDRLPLVQAATFSGAVSSMFCALLNGAALFPINPGSVSAASLAQWVRDHQLTMWHSVPTLFRYLCSAGGVFPSVRVIRLEGDQALPSDVELYRQHFSPSCILVNGLGATETGITCQYFVSRETEVTGPVLPIGDPVQDMEIRLEGEAGEIAVKSKYLALGYWRQPELTAERFRACPEEDGVRVYLTGDVGRRRPDGCLELIGRKDAAAKIGGSFVEIPEIESLLSSLPGVQQAIVSVVQDRFGEQRLAAYVVAPRESRMSVSSMRRHLAKRLPAQMIPGSFVFLEAAPLNEYGKVDRRHLPAPANSRPLLDTPYAAPRTATEEAVARAWSAVLGLDDVGIDDHFFELGGQSLDLGRVLALLDLDATAFRRGLTIREIAEEIDRAGSGAR